MPVRSIPAQSTPIRLRQAHVDDCAALSALAMRSKAHWGYDAAFMAACRDELTVTPDRLADGLVYLAERDGGLLGFYGLLDEGETADVAWLFVTPAAIGSGAGRALFAHMVKLARRRGFRKITIASDPQADGFYRHMGARRVGNIPSDSIPGRSLPLLELPL